MHPPLTKRTRCSGPHTRCVQRPAAISEKFKKDVAGAIGKAETNWKTIEHKPVGEL